MYSAPCRWYQGGPIGRIRFYEVPATNRQFYEPNVFWPWPESEANCYNVDNPGQVEGSTTYYAGDNLRPDLTGQHVDGTPADFLGAPLPAVIVPPECSVAPGMRLPLQFRAASTRSLGPLFSWSTKVRFWRDVPAECYDLWLRPDVLRAQIRCPEVWLVPDIFVNPFQGESLVDWVDSSAARDNFENPSGSHFPSLNSLTPLPYYAARFLPGDYLTADTPIVLADTLTIYLVAAISGVGATLGPLLGSAISDVAQGLLVLAGDVTYRDSAQSCSVVYAPVLGALTIYEVRRGSGAVELRINGTLMQTFIDDPAGTCHVNVLSTIALFLPGTGTVDIPEVIVSHCRYTDFEDSSVIQYLLNKYQISVEPVLVGSGGQTNDGAATLVTAAHLVGSGGQTNDGTATLTFHGSPFVVGSGGQTNAGAATLVTAAHLVGSGGQTNDGTATLRASDHITGSGGQTNNGSADMVFAGELVGSGGQTNNGAATLTPGGTSSWTLVLHVSAGSADNTTVTTSPLDTTGANLLVVSLACYHFAPLPTLTDSFGNTWTQRTVFVDGASSSQIVLFYCASPTVGAGHTFSASASGSYPSLVMLGWNTAPYPATFDQQSGAGTAASAVIQPGAVTPSLNNELIVTAVAFAISTPPTLNGLFTLDITVPYAAGQCFGQGVGYYLQSTAASVNPTWTFIGPIPAAATLGSFSH